jgi:subtilisin
MKRAAMLAAVLALSVTMVGAQPASGAARSRSYIVVFKDSVARPAALARIQAQAYGARIRFTYSHALKGYAASIPDAAVTRIRADRRVLFVSPDRQVQATAPAPCTDLTLCQRISNGVDRIEGDLSSTRSGDRKGAVNINVAVLDTGIGFHPDLNVAGGVDCTTNGKGGFDDLNGHGTMVGGLIGAKDNDFGRVGVAPGANLWAVRVLKQNASGTTSEVICGIDWVTATRTDSDSTNDIAVANMSLGGQSKDADDGNCGLTNRDAIHQAICSSVAAGVTYVVSAGNDSRDIKDVRPAAYDEVLTATAMADYDGQPGGLAPTPSGCVEAGPEDDLVASFTNFATLGADRGHTLAAPGVCLGSTYLNGTYAIDSGTSFAAPLTAGTVALCIASGKEPCAGFAPAQIVQKIVGEATAYNTRNPTYGFTGDPLHNPDPNKYYGFLIRAALY